MTGWTFSFNEEFWKEEVGFDSREDACAAARAEDREGPFWTGRCVPAGIPSISGDTIVEMLGERMYDSVGEIAEDWPDMNKGRTAMLGTRVDDAIEAVFKAARLMPKFFTLEDTQVHDDKYEEIIEVDDSVEIDDDK
ncbi:MAG: hypothetical protein DRH30_07900 [Deltaproteobacteria bacterium]|nr:MAG: hypothetical protein DRH30_07900 [Deltaproteobacteria bacterium]